MLDCLGRWNVYISPFTGQAMYSKYEVLEEKGSEAMTLARRAINENIRIMTAHYWGRPRYRINIKPKVNHGLS